MMSKGWTSPDGPWNRKAAFLLLGLLISSPMLIAISADSPSDENLPPSANAGQDISGVLLNDIVMLNGTLSSDEDIDNCTFLWSSTSHTSIVINDPGSRTPTFKVTIVATLVFELKVTDPEGLFDTDTVNVFVDANLPPNAVMLSPGPSGAVYIKGDPIEFSANTSSDPEGRPLTYHWSSNITGDLSSDQRYFTRALTTVGWRRITLNVSDLNGGYDIEEVEIRVRDPPSAPNARIRSMATTYNKRAPIAFDASPTTDADPGEVLNFTWRTDIGQGRVIGYGMLLQTTLEEGLHNITLNVTDLDGLSDEDSITITVRNRPPVAVIEGPSVVNVSEVARFSGTTSRDPDDDELTYSWDFGDGRTGAGAQVDHSWSMWGNYDVRLTVDDGSLIDHNATALFRIRINSVPVANIELMEEPLVGEYLPITANGSYDEDGDRLSYRWDLNGDGTFDAQGFSTGTVFNEEGDYIIILEVSDGHAFSTTELEITVTYPNQVPVADAGGDRVIPLVDDRGETDLDGSLSYDPDDDINGNGMIDGNERDNLTYYWDLDITKDSDGDGIPDNDRDRKGKVIRFVLNGPGPVRVALNVTDRYGAWDKDIIEIRGSYPPEFTRVWSTPGERSLVGLPVTFEATARDQDRNDVLTITWYIEDITKTGAKVSHTFDTPGNKEIEVMVSDGHIEVRSSLQVNVEDLPPPRITSPGNNSIVGDIVTVRGTAREAAGLLITSVEISINGGEWLKCKGSLDWSTWSYDWDTREGVVGSNTIDVRIVVERSGTVVYSSTRIYVEIEPEEQEGIDVLLIIVAAFIILFCIVLIFIFTRKRRTLDIPPPPVAGPQMPAQFAPPMQKMPEPAKAPSTPRQAPPAPEKKENVVRIKCPACMHVFAYRDTGERPVHLVCDRCGAKGVVDSLPGDEREEPKDEEVPPEEGEGGTDPIPIICPKCSGLFEISQRVDRLSCPFCGAEGDLDSDTERLIEERFGPGPEKLTLRCPKCREMFEIKENASEIACPHCGVKGKI